MRHRYLLPCSHHFFPFPSIFVAKATSLCAMKFLGICTFAHVYKPRFLSVGTHYCLAVGNDEGLELDETDEDEELGESDEEEVEEYKG